MSSDHFQYDNTVRGIVERITYQLNDAEIGYENQSWSEEWITSRVLDTFKWLQSTDPSLFAEEQTITLTSGAKHSLPEGCQLLSFDCYVDRAGNEVPIFMTDYKNIKAAQAYAKLMKACFYSGCAMQAAVNPKNSREILVDPAIPAGTTLDIRVSCSEVGSYFDDLDKPIECDFAKYITAVVDWVLSQALAMDSLNPALLATAQLHRENFFTTVPYYLRFQEEKKREQEAD